MNARAGNDGPTSKSWSRWAACLLALGVQVVVSGRAAHAGGFEAIPVCGQCPSIVDDPARICTGSLRWGFSYDPSDRVPDQPSGALLKDLIDPVEHDYELWIFLGSAGLVSPTACTSQTCLFQKIPHGSFQKTGDGKYSYQDPTATVGGMKFISSIGFARRRDGQTHVTVKGFAATPVDGKISLVLTQLGNVNPLPGGGSTVEPTVSFGIDRRHASWNDASCGWTLRDVGGTAPQLFCAPSLGGQCETVPTPLCPERLHIPPAMIRQNPGGLDTVELHVALTPSTTLSPSAEALTVTLEKTSAPAVAVGLAALDPGSLELSSGKYKFQNSHLKAVVTPRNNGQLVLDVIAKAPLPPFTDQDDLLVTIALGPDSYALPAQPEPWSYNSKGNLIVKGGAEGLPFCLNTP